ncbi:MAG: hypothetical protein NC081_00680 [Roseburia sp.]|nr:hypothetical protein [Roseburia sp.]
MSININVRQDLSSLFSSFNKSTGSGGLSSLLSDYASIKNGSYGKLMKAYYKQDASDSVKAVAQKSNSKKAVTAEESKALTKMQSTTDSLKESADKLLVTGSKSLFAQKDIVSKDENGLETTEKGYDTEAIYKAVNSFVTNYNAVVNASKDVADTTINNRVNNLTNNTWANEKSLEKIGITVNSDNTLSINKDTFMNADMNRVKTLFQGSGSYGYQTSAQASLINYAADSAASRASTYSASGSYNKYNTGNLYNGYF